MIRQKAISRNRKQKWRAWHGDVVFKVGRKWKAGAALLPGDDPGRKRKCSCNAGNLETYVQNGRHSGRGKRGHEFRAVSERRRWSMVRDYHRSAAENVGIGADAGDAAVTGSAFRAVAPVSAVCAAFTAQPSAYPPGAGKPDVAPPCGNVAETASAGEGSLQAAFGGGTSRKRRSRRKAWRFSAPERPLLPAVRAVLGGKNGAFLRA